MQKFSIKLDKRNLNKILRAADKVKTTATKESQNLPRTGAEQYVNRVLKAINKVRWTYGGKYNKRYMDWKLRNYKVHVPWKLEGDLVKAVKAYKMPASKGTTSYIGGVKAGITDSGGKSWFGEPGGKGAKGPPKEIAMYGRAMEKRKPLFVPIFNEYKPMFKNKFKRTTKTIRRIWR